MTRMKRVSIFGVNAFHLYFNVNDKTPTYDFRTTSEYTKGIIYYIKGTPEVIVTRTGDVIDHRKPGMLTTERETPVYYEEKEIIGFNFIDETEWICIPFANNTVNYKFSSLVIPKGEKVTVPVGSKVFVARGIVRVNGKDYIRDKEIMLKFNSVEFEAIEDSYLLLVQ